MNRMLCASINGVAKLVFRPAGTLQSFPAVL